MKTLISLYTIKLPKYFVYMLQQVEYNPSKFAKWTQHVFDENKKISAVIQRKKLVYSPKAVALLVGLYVVASVVIVSPLVFFDFGIPLLLNTTLLLIALPPILFLLAMLLTSTARVLFVAPRERSMIKQSKAVFSKHKGIKIAVLGSYGKTSMKEILSTLLSEEKNIAVTPGNMNTAVSHARFSQTLTGKEDVLVVEFGEGAPGDIAQMAKTLQPDYAVVTGLAPNHLDFYSSIDAIANDLLSIYDFVDEKNIFMSKESGLLSSYLPKKSATFSNKEVLGWKISNIIISVADTSFTMKKGKNEFNISTGLIGRHQVAPIAFAVALADVLGVDKKQIIDGCSKIHPYEHRMQPRKMHGAWIIDDTYNGNIEGMKAGLKLLDELDIKRKWYVTPGLVDQGSETYAVHSELGKTIAAIQPDIVVLMDNSVRPIIQKSMEENGFSKELRIEKNPLEFYTNIEHVTVAGDVVLMQNDWTDNYN